MKRERIFIHIGIILFSFLLFVAWYQDGRMEHIQTATMAIRNYKVYLITTDRQYEYWRIMDQGASAMANATGIQYVWDAPEYRDVYKQIEVINKAVNDGANALLIAADDPKEITSAVEDAKARGVKIIYVDAPANEEAITTLATNNYEAGVLAGQTLLDILDERGVGSGSIGIVSIADKENTELREAGFRDVLSERNSFTVLQAVYTDGEPIASQRAAQLIVDQNSDLVALFGTNEGTSQGIGYTNQINDNRYVGIGFDRTEAMLQLLENGNLSAIIVQNPFTMGYLGVAEAIAAIYGKDTGPPYINTGVSVIRNK